MTNLLKMLGYPKDNVGAGKATKSPKQRPAPVTSSSTVQVEQYGIRFSSFHSLTHMVRIVNAVPSGNAMDKLSLHNARMKSIS